MTLINPIHYLANLGLTITINNNKLNIKPSHLVTDEILNYIKQYKDSIKNELLVASQKVPKLPQLIELTLKQQLWLNQIAIILQVTSEYLLQHHLIDQYDLVELLDNPPVIMANTVKAGYYWLLLQ